MTVQLRSATYRAETHIQKRADGSKVVTGYASVFGSRNSFDEIFRPGAFAKSLTIPEEARSIVHLVHHDDRIALGKPTLREDDKGLHFETVPLKTRAAQEALEEIEAGVLNGVSIGFSFRREGGAVWVEGRDGEEGYLEVTDVRLWEHSNVRWGSDPNALAEIASRCVCGGRCTRCRANAAARQARVGALDHEMIRRASGDMSLPPEARKAASDLLRALEAPNNPTPTQDPAPLLGGVFDALGAVRASFQEYTR